MKLVVRVDQFVACSAAMLVTSAGRADQDTQPQLRPAGSRSDAARAASMSSPALAARRALGTAADPDGGCGLFADRGPAITGPRIQQVNNDARGPGASSK